MNDEDTNVADNLPRLSEAAEDDLPWPADTTDFSGDAGEEGDEQPVDEKAYVKEIHKDGREDVYMADISMKSTGVYLKPTEAYPVERMLEWDADEEIWFCGEVIGGEE